MPSTGSSYFIEEREGHNGRSVWVVWEWEAGDVLTADSEAEAFNAMSAQLFGGW